MDCIEALVQQVEADGLYVQLQQRPDLKKQEFLKNAFYALQEALAGFIAMEIK